MLYYVANDKCLFIYFASNIRIYTKNLVYTKPEQCLCFKMLSLSHNIRRGPTFRVDVGVPQMIECVRQNVTTGLENVYNTCL